MKQWKFRAAIIFYPSILIVLIPKAPRNNDFSNGQPQLFQMRRGQPRVRELSRERNAKPHQRCDNDKQIPAQPKCALVASGPTDFEIFSDYPRTVNSASAELDSVGAVGRICLDNSARDRSREATASISRGLTIDLPWLSSACSLHIGTFIVFCFVVASPTPPP